jgi:hypothetical protein
MVAITAAALLALTASGASAVEAGPLFPVLRDGRWGYIDRGGQVVIPPRFERAAPSSEGLAAIQDGELFGYVDAAGKQALVPEQLPAGVLHRPFRSGLAAVRVGALHGYIDRKGRLAIPARYTTADDFTNGYAMACDGRGCGYIDPDGRGVVGYGFMGSAPVSEGVACITLAMGMGHQRVELRRLDGSVIPGEWEGCGKLSEGLVAVRFGGKWGFVDGRGQVVIQRRFDKAGDFVGGLAPVTVAEGRCGYADKTGRLAIPARFRACQRFSDGLARVDLAEDPSDTEQVAFIDRDGKTIVAGAKASPPFDSAEDFRDGLAAVGVGGPPHMAGSGTLLGYVDRTGRYAWTPTN